MISRIGVALMLLAAPAIAQDAIVALDTMLMAGWSGNAAALEQTQQTRRSWSQPRGSRVTQAQPAQFAFRPDPAVRQQVHARVLRQAQKLDPDSAAKLRPLLTSGTLDRQASAYLRRYGMSANNVADTTALFLVSAWLATRASDADPSRAHLIGVRNQAAAAMASNPGMARASNAMKQEIAEANLIQAVITGQFATAAKQNPKQAPAIRAAAAKGVRDSYGIDLLSLQLTSSGLR